MGAGPDRGGGILIAREPSIKTIADLKGKRIGVPFASTAHFSLLTALEKAGIAGQAQVLNLTPDAIRGAWLGKQIDAAYIWEPTLAELHTEGAHVLTGQCPGRRAGSPTYDERRPCRFRRAESALLRGLGRGTGLGRPTARQQARRGRPAHRRTARRAGGEQVLTQIGVTSTSTRRRRPLHDSSADSSVPTCATPHSSCCRKGRSMRFVLLRRTSPRCIPTRPDRWVHDDRN